MKNDFRRQLIDYYQQKALVPMKRFLAILCTFLFWQAQVAADPQLDVEKLMNDMLPFGQEMLEKHGEFLPYGAAMKLNGEIVSVSGGVGLENPESQKIIDVLKETFQEGAIQKRFKATAIFYDVSTALPGSGEKTDAIAVALDHVSNVSVAVFLPYKLVGSRVVFGDTFASYGANDIFGQ